MLYTEVWQLPEHSGAQSSSRDPAVPGPFEEACQSGVYAQHRYLTSESAAVSRSGLLQWEKDTGQSHHGLDTTLPPRRDFSSFKPHHVFLQALAPSLQMWPRCGEAGKPHSLTMWVREETQQSDHLRGRTGWKCPMWGNFLGQRSSLADFSASPLTLGSNKQTKASGQQGAQTTARLGQTIDRICTMWVATYN